MAFKDKYLQQYPGYDTGSKHGSIDVNLPYDYQSRSFEQQSQGSYTGQTSERPQDDRFYGAVPRNMVPDYEQENTHYTSHGNNFAQHNDSYSDDDRTSSPGQRLHSKGVSREMSYEGKSPRKRLPRERSPEDSFPRGRSPEDRFPRGRSPEDRLPRGRSPEDRFPRGMSPEDRFQRGRSPEDRFPRGRSPEDRFPRGRSPEDRFPRGRSPDDRFPRGRSPEDRFPRGRSPDDRFPRGRSPEDRFPRGRSPEDISLRERLQEDRFPRENVQGKRLPKEILPLERDYQHDAAFGYDDGNSQDHYEGIDNVGFVRTGDADLQAEQDALDVKYRGNGYNLDFTDGTRTKIFRRKSKRFLESVQGNDDISSLDGEATVYELPSDQQKDKQPLRDKLTLLREQKSLHGVVSVYRDQIVREPVSETTGYKAWHHRQKQAWQRFKLQAKSWIYQLEPWSGALKEVEGQFGTSIMGYFRFVRWLMFLNLYICLVNICLTLVPYFVLYKSPSNFSSSVIGPNLTIFQTEAVNCTLGYKEELITVESDVFGNILHFLQGTGWMEDTVLFYGAFFNKTYTSPIQGKRETYHMGLSYLLATGVSFIISFFVIVKNSSKGLKDTAVIQGATMAMYSNKVLTGWDFCISQAKAAKTKHSNISGELKKDLEIQRFMWKMESRTTGDKIKLYLLRMIINILMCFLLGGSLYLIYLSFSQLLVLQKEFKDTTQALQFVIQYIPSVTITLLNIIVPIIFKKVVLLEDYTPSFEMIMTLLRTILLRLSSLGVLMISIYQLLQRDDPQYEHLCGNKRWSSSSSLTSNTSTNVSGSIIKCWETYVGQQIYKLVILDFLVLIIVTFLVELPRRLVYNTLSKKFKLIDMVGLPEVDLPKVVLDIVYAQTLCWMGLFFSPLIPFMCFLKCFIVFYVKKFTLLNNYVAPTRPYRTTRSNSLFIGMLFISFLMAAIPITYMVGNFNPSQSCGPFRVYSTNHTVFFDTVAHVILEWPAEAQNVFFFLGKSNFFIPAILVMCLIMYYYWAVKEGLTKMEKMLQEQLKLEGRDKQFLLARVNEIVQHMDTGGATTG